MENSHTLDKYPTRLNSRSKIIKRNEPVIYSTKPFLPQLVDYDELGYAVIKYKKSWQPNLELLYTFVNTCKNQTESHKMHYVREDNSMVLKSIFGLYDISIYEYLVCSGVLPFVAYILNENLYIHQTRLNVKSPYSGREFGWHSDFETWHAEDGMPRMRALSVMIALTENTKLNGSLLVVPGSHKVYVSCSGNTPINNYTKSLVNQTLGIIPQSKLEVLVKSGGMELIELSQGDILIFDCNLAHGSNLNLSTRARENLFVCINGVSNKLKLPYSFSAPRPEFLAHRDSLIELT